MFRKMRLTENQLSENEAREILYRCTHGMLALDGDSGYTYAVPLSYAVDGDTIYFHGAKSGHKLDAIANNDKVSFCVVEKDEIIPEDFNSLFRSAVVFGKIRILSEDAERQKGLDCILRKYSADYMESGQKYVEGQWDNVAVMELCIEHLTGKKGT